jgi:hypothetical protein
MKKLIPVILLLLAGSTMSFAQCGKNILFTSSKTEYLDTNGVVQRSEDENTLIEITKTEITITPGEHKMTGTIKSDSCNWKTAWKEGKKVVKAQLTDGEGNTKNVTITIEGKDGKITLLAQIADMPGQVIRVTADKFEEKK